MRGDKWAYASGGAYPRLSFLAAFLDRLALGAFRFPFPGDVELFKASTWHLTSGFRDFTAAATLKECRKVGSSELWAVATAESNCGWHGVEINVNLEIDPLNFSVTDASPSLRSSSKDIWSNLWKRS